MKIAIVGNGIAGLSSAEKILKNSSDPSLEIFIFGTQERHNGASAAAAAMLAVFCEIELGYLDKKQNKIKFEHALESSKLWRERHSKPSESDKNLFKGGFGTHLIKNESMLSLDNENFEEIVKYLEIYDEDFVINRESKIPGYSPRSEWKASSSLYIPSEGWFDPIHYLRNLEKILSNNVAVKIIRGEVDKIEKKNGYVDVIFEGQKLMFDKVLLANGARFNELIEKENEFGIKVKILAGVGTTIRLKNDKIHQTKVVRSPNRGLACGMYSVPFSKNGIVLGATNFITTKPKKLATIGAVDSLIKMAFQQLNTSHFDSELISIQTGWRPVSSDLFPIIGWLDENIFVYTGTRRDGWVTSEMFSTKVAKMILNDESDEQMSIYNPKRDPHVLYNRKEAIGMATKQYLDGLLQHGYVAPDGAYPKQIEKNYRTFFEKLHDDKNMGTVGIPVDFISQFAAEIYETPDAEDL